MRVCVLVELEVGDSPVAEAITYHIVRYGTAPSDDRLAPEEWVEAVIVDGIQRSVDENHIASGADWKLLSSYVSRSD